jgi:nitroreductase
MNIYEAIQKRRSIRKYKSDDIAEDKLNRILETARLAPSGKNGQPWRFIVVKDKTLRNALVPACRDQGFISEAPIVIVACAKEEESYQKQGGYMKSWTIDIGIALEHIMLAAVAEGLGSCWIGAFEEAKVREVLKIPADLRIVALTPLGYPAQDPTAKPRKATKEVIFYNHL